MCSYVLKVPFENTGGAGIVYVWVGSKTTQEEQIHAEQMGRTMFEVSGGVGMRDEGEELITCKCGDHIFVVIGCNTAHCYVVVKWE